MSKKVDVCTVIRACSYEQYVGRKVCITFKKVIDHSGVGRFSELNGTVIKLDTVRGIMSFRYLFSNLPHTLNINLDSNCIKSVILWK